METNLPMAAGITGSSAVVGGAFAAFSKARSPKVIALGAATGVAAGAANTAIAATSPVPEFALGGSIAGGAVTGAFLMRPLAQQGLKPIAQHGIGAALGGATGLLGTIAVGIVLAQLD